MSNLIIKIRNQKSKLSMLNSWNGRNFLSGLQMCFPGFPFPVIYSSRPGFSFLIPNMLKSKFNKIIEYRVWRDTNIVI